MEPHLLRITTIALSLEVLLSGQAEFMEQNGFKVSLASAGKLRNNQQPSGDDIKHYSIPMLRKIAPFRDIYSFFVLLVLMIRLKPDIVHTHTPKAGLLGMVAAKLTRVPIRIHTVGGLPLMTASGWKRSLLVIVEKLSCWGALHVWPNSKSLLNYIKEQRLCPKDKLSIIADGSSNGIDLEAFSRSKLSQTTVAQVKRSINYQEDNSYLLAVGRMVKDKGIDELIVAFELLFSKKPNLRLLLIGPLEELRPEEKLSASTLEVIQQHDAIHHVNWTTEVAAYLSLSDLLIHASHREGFPNVLLQAAAMECPIVCADIAGNIDVVTHRETGLTYPVGNIPDLVDAVVETLLNPKQAQLRTQRLRARIEKKFDRKRLQKALLIRYRQLLQQDKS